MTDKPGGSGLTVDQATPSPIALTRILTLTLTLSVDQIHGVLAILPTAEDVEVCQGYDLTLPLARTLNPNPNPNLNPKPIALTPILT